MLQSPMSHWARAVRATSARILARMGHSAAKSTAPGPRSKSTALPVRMGTYSVLATVITHSASEAQR